MKSGGLSTPIATPWLFDGFSERLPWSKVSSNKRGLIWVDHAMLYGCATMIGLAVIVFFIGLGAVIKWVAVYVINL